MFVGVLIKRSLGSTAHGPILLLSAVLEVDILVRYVVLFEVSSDKLLEPLFDVALDLDSVTMELFVLDLHSSSSSAKLLAHLASYLGEVTAVFLETDDR